MAHKQRSTEPRRIHIVGRRSGHGHNPNGKERRVWVSRHGYSRRRWGAEDRRGTAASVETQHTPGTIQMHDAMIIDDTGKCIAVACSTEEIHSHLVTCWNACDGINPEAVRDMSTALNEAITDDGAAAFGSRDYAERRLREINEVARAAIAKAKITTPSPAED